MGGMGGIGKGRATSRGLLCAILLGLLAAAPARAIELLDGRLQAHGFGEVQMRAIAKNYDTSDGLDLTQWYWVFNAELEYDFLPDGWRFVDLLQGYARVEVRYDCVWTRGCGTMRSADTFGDRAKRMPGRIGKGHLNGYDGQALTGDFRERLSVTITESDYLASLQNGLISPGGPVTLLSNLPNKTPSFKGTDFGVFTGATGTACAAGASVCTARGGLWNVPGVSTLFGIEGLDGVLGTADDPATNLFENFLDYRFTLRKLEGPTDGNATQTLGPWHPKDEIQPVASLNDRPNPFNPNDPNVPVLGAGGVGGSGLPFRPYSEVAVGSGAQLLQSQGVYYPSAPLRGKLASNDFEGLTTGIDQNFSQSELSWNRGASQQDEKELKELYFDVELFDARLWMRLGKQSIVWGKTELFRTTDQFNPQDLGLASLPSLEESRISLWAARFVYSLYEVGPLEDVRLELAFNFDDFEPADLGRCGEAYTPNVACNLTFGYFAHGLTGLALAGTERPDDPWDSFDGWEIGGRAEFRWDRFSFALMNFYGYHDTPFVERLINYERNVDPSTGRPRSYGSQSPCDPEGTGDTSGCLGVLDAAGDPILGPGDPGDPNSSLTAMDAVRRHSANQQIFAMVCASSVGFSTLDTSACGQSVFNSTNPVPGLPLIGGQPAGAGAAVALILAGQDTGAGIYGFLSGLGGPNAQQLLVNLNRDFRDGPGAGLVATDSLSFYLTDEQEALLGCGAFYGTNCDLDPFGGLDLLNAEASVLMQSFPSVVGAPSRGFNWDAVGPSGEQIAQPGTAFFNGDPVAMTTGAQTPVGTRFLPNGTQVQIVGARGPWDAAYDPFVDGCSVRTSEMSSFNLVPGAVDPASACNRTGAVATRTLVHTIQQLENGFNQPFRSEMAALSYNLALLLIMQSGDPDDSRQDFNPDSWDGQALPSQGGNPSRGTDVNRLPGDPGADGIPGTIDDGAKCSLITPQFCTTLNAFYSISGDTRNDRVAGGNTRFGRRDFAWHGGGEGSVRYQKRNVLGFSMDFAEDRTLTNWGIESTWISELPFGDADSANGVSHVDTYNLTVSVDRPTWINFLNESRTFFLNSQWFFQYIDGYHRSMPSNGPWNVLATFTVQGGYFQDRLLPSNTLVYDFQSQSGAVLPSITYRYSANFQATFGLAAFWGRFQSSKADLRPLGLQPNRVGHGAYSQFSENLLSLVNDRDEVYLRLRYTF